MTLQVAKPKTHSLPKRSQSTYEALVAAGIDAARIEICKPTDINGGADLNEARRVVVSVE